MKEHASSQGKTTHQKKTISQQETSLGPQAISLAPPDHGIDFTGSERIPTDGDAIQRLFNETPAQRAGPPFNPDDTPVTHDQSAIRNNTGMSDRLKAGIENLSGHSMDDVHVLYNSSRPAQLQALAYTQGTDIHVGPGQERHLPHEAWHVVQQKQGRVTPTVQVKNTPINDEAGLEEEADVMGDKASQASDTNHLRLTAGSTPPTPMIQRVVNPSKASYKTGTELLDMTLKALHQYTHEQADWHSLPDSQLHSVTLDVAAAFPKYLQQFAGLAIE